MDTQKDESAVSVMHRLGVTFRVLPRVLAFAWQAKPITLLITSLFNVVIALIPAGIVWMTKLIVDGVVEATTGEGDWYTLIPFALTVFALWMIQSVCGSVVDQVKLVLSEPLGFLAQERLAEKPRVWI